MAKMKNQHHRSNTDNGDSTIITKINSMKLIHLVRSQDVLYNSEAEGYNDKNHKEIIWERITKALVSRYDGMSNTLKETVRMHVRRRWKTLRNAIAREVKKNATIENYCRKKESPIIAELEFLIPHIKSSYCAKLADALGLRENINCFNEADGHDGDVDEEDFNDLIDLTEDSDMKPCMRSCHLMDASRETTTNGGGVYLAHESLYPNVQINVNGGEGGADDACGYSPHEAATSVSNWSNEYCTLAEYKGGEFMNSTALFPIKEQHQPAPPPQPQMPDTTATVTASNDPPSTSSLPTTSTTNNENRRRAAPLNVALSSEDSAELQSKILQLMCNLERRERSDQDGNDEDRMFLLSLVSDLKRVPAAKKMMVKAEIATAIARAIP